MAYAERLLVETPGANGAYPERYPERLFRRRHQSSVSLVSSPARRSRHVTGRMKASGPFPQAALHCCWGGKLFR
jgi:hypothetical protein